MTLLRYSWLSLLLLGTACTPGVVNRIQQAALDDTSAIVYLYRPDSMSNVLISPALSIDDTNSLVLKNDSYTWLRLPPGLHRLQMQLSSRYQGQHELELLTEAGKAYYLRVDTQMKFRKNDLYDRSFDLRQVQDKVALQEMAACQFFRSQAEQQPQVQTEDRPVSTDSADDAEFSITKSRDPFSRNR